MNTRTSVSLVGLALGLTGLTGLTGPALADNCPPSVAAFDTWTWLPGSTSGDNWMTNIVCASNATRAAAKALVVANMGLGANWDYWDEIIPTVDDCNPDTWGARVVNGGYAVEYVGINRDNDTFSHWATPTGILPNGTAVTHWLTQYVALYIAEEGYNWQCLASMDLGGPSDGFTYASNPNSNSACSLYYPWFWNKTVTDRASTIVHEATHEFSPHISNSACGNGGSCDDVFMNANAQSFQIIFDAQSVDAYQRESGSRELKVVGYGNGVCGYLPLLPDAERFSQVQVMQSKLGSVFQTVPTQASWPTAAFIDNVAGTIYDIAAQPNGAAGQAYRIDVTNQAMWPCNQVCNAADFTFNSGGPSGARACNEDYQAANAGRNAANRQRCNDLNAQVAAGVTPAERSGLLAQANNGMQACMSGISDEYIARVCDDAMIGADHVQDIESAWSIPEDMGYGYDAEESIRACQGRFCRRQPLGSWNEDAFAICYEWDDPAGCMELACGDLSAIEAAKGRDSFEYLNALVCRAAELGRDVESLDKTEEICEQVFDECLVREQLLPLWLAQLEDGPCWSENLQSFADPLFVAHRRSIGNLSVERFTAADRGPRLLSSACLMKEQECEAMQAALAALHAKLAGIKATERPKWRQPPLPDPWEMFEGRFDRELVGELSSIAEELAQVGAARVPLSRNQRLMRTVNKTEARVAIAELVGQDLYFSTGGGRFAEGAFAPERLAQFRGENAQHDAYGLETGGFEAEIQALQTLNSRVESQAWQALIEQSGQLPAGAYYTHLVAMLQAADGQSLLAAHDALQQDLQALVR